MARSFNPNEFRTKGYINVASILVKIPAENIAWTIEKRRAVDILADVDLSEGQTEK